MTAEFDKTKTKSFDNVDFTPYEDKKKLEEEYKQLIRDEIDKENAKMNDEEKTGKLIFTMLKKLKDYLKKTVKLFEKSINYLKNIKNYLEN